MNKIDGRIFESMIRNGLRNLKLHEKEINDMNVFPVPDGDTGTNMKLTLENGIRTAGSESNFATYTEKLQEGMLLGARGNSGVILSQLFRGFYLKLQRCSIINPREMHEGLVGAYKTAYESVVRPVEGTILTVAREGAENTKQSLTRGTTFERLLSVYIAEMKKSLQETPNILKDLKDAGVVDSGGYGFIIIFEGMLKDLYGEKIEIDETEEKEEKKVPAPNGKFFDENSEFEKGYCTEFLLQLMNSKNGIKLFKRERLIEDLKLIGNSIVCVQSGTIVKVHVHTKFPGKAIGIAQEYGEFISFKIENMQIQYNEQMQKKMEHKALGIICVADGDGICQTFKDFNCDMIISNEVKGANLSSEDFLNAFKKMNADHIAVFPNNHNLFKSAEQAVKLSGMDNITILPTKNIIECYYALAMDVPNSEDIGYRIDLMKQGIDAITSIEITTAIKDYKSKDIVVKEGESIAMLNNEIVASASSIAEVLVDAMKKIESIDDKQSMIIYKGESFDESLEETITDAILDNFPMIDVNFQNGGQEIYDLSIGII